MSKPISSLLALLLLPLLALAQLVTVPRNVYFADIHLTLSNGAQEEIQKKVDALHRNQTYFKMKVDLADAYFPVIERVFKEEGVPDDYKFLALQESGLIGDAVSTSNAVGYWQFKREAASDFNLRMDHRVDERRHIIEASRGAAKYFLRSNNYYNNWLNSLLSYYLGYSGAKPYTRPSDNGARRMEITERVNPYILTFLAHKIAYETFIGKSNPPALSLREMRGTPGQSLADIAMSTKTDYAELEKYNKWLLGGSIPSDKDYYVMVPVRNGGSDAGLLASKGTAPAAKGRPAGAVVRAERSGLNTIVARPGDTKDKLARQAGISTRKFLRYNDLHNFDRIEPGATYYTEKKNMTANAEYHVVQPGETMQQISQHHGIRLNYLLFKNRMGRSEVPVPGRVLWLQKRRPAHTPVEVRDLGQKQPATAAAAPSYSQPAVAATASAGPDTTREEQQAPRESIFRRFINSFKRFKNEKPAPRQEEEIEEEKETAIVAETEKPAPAVRAQTTVASKQVPAAESKSEEEEEDGFMDSFETDSTGTDAVAEASATQEPATAPQKKKPAMYPQTDTTSIFQEPAPETKVDILLDSVPATSPVVAKDTTAAEENWVIRTATGEDSATEVKDIFVEPAATPAAKSKPTAATPKKAAPAAAAKPAPKPTKHVVGQGETLYAISRMYAVTVNDLNAWNKLGDAPLRAGQELYIAEPLVQPDQAETEESHTASQPASNSAYHTVASGETLYLISKTYNVSLEELREWNGLANNSIRLGQELRVQAPTRAASPEKEADSESEASAALASGYHTVATGESMYQISRKYGVTIKDIMQWNDKSDFSVSIGEKLLIRKK